MKGGRLHLASWDVGQDPNPAYEHRLLRKLWRYIHPHRRLLFFALGLLPLSSVFNLVQPYLVKLAIDLAVVPRQLNLLAPLALAIISAVLLERLTQLGETLLLQLCGQRAMHDLRVAGHRHMLSLRSAYFDRTPVGKLMTRLTNDVESITEAFSMGLVSVVGDIITLVGIVAVMLWMSPWLAMISLAVLPLLLVVVEVFRRLLRNTHRLIRRRIAQINASLQEHITGMKVVQIFGLQGHAARDFDEANRAHRDAYKSAIVYDASLFALVEMLGSVTVALLLWYGGLRVLEETVTFGLLVAFLEYVQKFFIPIRDLSAKYTIMQQAMAASERVFDLLDTSEHEGSAAPSSKPVTRSAPAGQDQQQAAAVAFAEVSFQYSSNQQVLHRLSFTVAQGESVAVVGPTGAGKTTLARLITRLYEVDSGRILLQGRDLRALPPQDVRRQVTVVNQDVFMFSGTVESNISLDNPRITRDQVERAAQRVGLSAMLDLDRPVLERGSNLSAGERQLVAFARALVREPEILILDEATSSVDPESERIIQAGIKELMRDRTSMVIAHRLTTIEQAHRIMVLCQGCLAEQGTHSQLLAADGFYSRLHKLQYVEYTESVTRPPAAQ